MSLDRTSEQVTNNSFVIEIYGLGYVGFPLAIQLSKSGKKIRGIETNEKRINRLKENKLLDSEIHLKSELKNAIENGNLMLDSKPQKMEIPKIGIICVPTPIFDDNTKSDVFVISAAEAFLSASKSGDVLILESSIGIGTTESVQKLIKEKGYDVGRDFGLCFCPERVDPANEKWNIENIPRVIYCSDDQSFAISKEIYNNVNGGNLIRVSSSKAAEVVKSFENTFRLVNISLVNELAMLCDKLGVNVREVIDAAATKPFGFLPHYPGAGAGGHCIPKDPRFLLQSARHFESNFTTIENALKINSLMPNYIADNLEKSLASKNLEKSIIISGLTYKPNIEDMRDSASFKLITHLHSRGFTVYGYDPYFNDKYIEKYLTENNLKELNFKKLDDLNDKNLENISCICIVQHHKDTKQRIMEIYKNSLVPMIYDCQHKIEKIPDTNCILEFLGE